MPRWRWLRRKQPPGLLEQQLRAFKGRCAGACSREWLSASMLVLADTPAHLRAVWDQADSSGLSGLLYVISMELSAGLPVLPQSSTGRALLLAALKGMRLPTLSAADVAVALDSTAGNGTAAVYAFSSSQPGIYLIAVRAALQVSLAVCMTRHCLTVHALLCR